MNARRAWNKEEDQVLIEFVKTYGEKHWGKIAKLLNLKLNIDKRTGKQCRERWHNFLNTKVNHGEWTIQEEEIVFTLYKVYRNQWTLIAENLPGRTDNAVKNYFYSTIRRSLRRMSKIIGRKNSTSQLKKIKPSTLSMIFTVQVNQKVNSLNESELLKRIHENGLIIQDEVMSFANFKPKKNEVISEIKKQKYEIILNMIMEINQINIQLKIQKDQEIELILANSEDNQSIACLELASQRQSMKQEQEEQEDLPFIKDNCLEKKSTIASSQKIFSSENNPHLQIQSFNGQPNNFIEKISVSQISEQIKDQNIEQEQNPEFNISLPDENRWTWSDQNLNNLRFNFTPTIIPTPTWSSYYTGMQFFYSPQSILKDSPIFSGLSKVRLDEYRNAILGQFKKKSSQNENSLEITDLRKVSSQCENYMNEFNEQSSEVVGSMQSAFKSLFKRNKE